MSSSLQEIVRIHKDGSLDNLAKEQAIRSIIQRDSEDGDLLSFLLAHSEDGDRNIGPAVESVEQFSHLFADVIKSPRFCAFVSWLKSKKEDQILTATVSMIKISWKLNATGKETPATHIQQAIDLGFSLMASANLSLAEQASRLVLAMFQDSNIQESLGCLKRYIDAHGQQTEIVFRYLSLATDLSADHEETARYSVDLGFLDYNFAICQGKDILLVINSLDLLAKWSRSRIGLDALCEKGIVGWLIRVSSDPTDFLLNSEALRTLALVFADAAHHSRGFITKLDGQVVQVFLLSILRRFREGDEIEKVTGLAILADFARISSQSLFLLSAVKDDAGHDLLQLWLGFLNSSKSEFAAAALSGFVKLLDHTEESYAANSSPSSIFSAADEVSLVGEAERVVQFKKMIFRLIGETKTVPTIHYLVKMAKQPIPVLRHAAVDLMRAVAEQPGGWGLQSLFGQSPETSEFWNYLRDRTTEYSKEGKDFKFSLISAVHRSPFVGLLGEGIQKQLDTLVKQGAYYMPPRMEDPETL